MSSVRSLLQRYDLSPKRSLGQNFLTDESYLDRIIDAAELTSADTVLEVGPGLGSLTRRLAQAAGQVIAIELDDRLIELLRTEFADNPNVSIIHSDILKTSVSSYLAHPSGDSLAPYRGGATSSAHRQPITQLGCDQDSQVSTTATVQEAQLAELQQSFKVVANLPYYITNAILRHFLEADVRPEAAVLMVQKEVAQRICAKPGKLSLLAVSVQFYAVPEIVSHVPAGAFYPRPKVDSAILHLDVLPKPQLEHVDPNQFFRIVKAGFGQKRKQLLNSLSAGLSMPKDKVVPLMHDAGIDPKRRAETLTIPEWGQVYDSFFGTD